MDYLLEHWDDILSIVKSEHDITDVSFKTWLKPLTIHSISGNTLRILVPTDQMGSMAVDYISKKYYFPLKVAIAEFTGNEYEIEFLLPEYAAPQTRQRQEHDRRIKQHQNRRRDADNR